MNCLFCHPEKSLVLKKYKYWTVMIHPYQSFLGRCRIVFNSHLVDFLDTDKKQKEELIRIMEQLKIRLVELFEPDLFNYATLGNFERHLHVHMIPRYEKPRVFQGIEIHDEKWNDIHRPYRKLELPSGVMEELKRQIKDGLK
jgi:diadenosine tetraphosphate (Ap4A) HIT family hydrolase